MDPITQGALGAACGQAVINRQPARVIWLSAALAGMAPDLDVLIRSSQEPLLSLLYHRHFTHSLIFIPIGAFFVATLLCLLFSNFRQHWQLTYLASLIGYATHGLLDAFTSYGTVLYWPFSLTRVSWDIIAIVDPMVTFPLVIGTALSVIFFKRRYALIALLLVFLLFLLNTNQHHKAVEAGRRYYQTFGHISRIRAIPEIASSTRWRIITSVNKQIYTGLVYVPIWGKLQLKPIGQFKQFSQSDLPNYVIKSPGLMRDYKIFHWFTDGWLIQAPDKQLILADGRYVTAAPLKSLWGIVFKKQQKHVTKKRFINLESKQ